MCLHACKRAHTHEHAHTHTHTHAHAHTHVHIYSYIHACFIAYMYGYENAYTNVLTTLEIFLIT
uniref:Uncharacterized protein n=1 Tax=Octopus bimaculoides TaxID=37653 RepID=A0A0L8H5S4_OCTBM